MKFIKILEICKVVANDFLV